MNETIESTTVIDEDPAWTEGGLEDLDDDTDTLEDEDDDTDTPEVASAKKAFVEAEKALRAARTQEEHDRRVKVFRGIPNDDQKNGFLTTTFRTEEDRQDFVGNVASIERNERVKALLDGDDKALAEGWREGDEELRESLKNRLVTAGNSDRLRLIADVAEEHVVELPTPDVDGDGKETQIDWAQSWAESPMSKTVPDVAVYVKSALAEVKTGKLRVDTAILEQLEELAAVADQLPASNPHRAQALREAAGLAQFARDEHEAAIPFGLGGITSTKQYMGPDKKWHELSVDGRGKTRDTVIEGDESSSAPADDEAVSPTTEQWMALDSTTRERLLREESEQRTEAARRQRAGGIDIPGSGDLFLGDES